MAEKNITPQNELLKDNYAELDTGTTTTPKGIDTTLEALGKVHRGKTLEGKAKSSRNATKDGKSLEVRELIKYLNGLLRDQKGFID